MTKGLLVENAEFFPIVREMLGKGHTVTINVRGYSMRPFLENDRDRVILAPLTRSPAVGDALLAEISPGHYVLHRLLRIEDNGQLPLPGDGNCHATETCGLNDVLGVVTHYLYPNHTVAASDAIRRFNVSAWRRLHPIRRYLLYIYKRICSVQ